MSDPVFSLLEVRQPRPANPGAIETGTPNVFRSDPADHFGLDRAYRKHPTTIRFRGGEAVGGVWGEGGG